MLHYNDKIVIESVGVKVFSIYECILLSSMLENDNHVWFIGAVQINGKVSDERNSMSACATVNC